MQLWQDPIPAKWLTYNPQPTACMPMFICYWLQMVGSEGENVSKVETWGRPASQVDLWQSSPLHCKTSDTDTVQYVGLVCNVLWGLSIVRHIHDISKQLRYCKILISAPLSSCNILVVIERFSAVKNVNFWCLMYISTLWFWNNTVNLWHYNNALLV